MSNNDVLFDLENSKTNPLYETGGIIDELSELESNEDIKECRICLESYGELISICNCNGSLKYVHQNCIEEWIRHSSNNKCEICNQQYDIDLLSISLEENKRCSNNMLIILYLMYIIIFVIVIILFTSYV